MPFSPPPPPSPPSDVAEKVADTAAEVVEKIADAATEARAHAEEAAQDVADDVAPLVMRIGQGVETVVRVGRGVVEDGASVCGLGLAGQAANHGMKFVIVLSNQLLA